MDYILGACLKQNGVIGSMGIILRSKTIYQTRIDMEAVKNRYCEQKQETNTKGGIYPHWGIGVLLYKLEEIIEACLFGHLLGLPCELSSRQQLTVLYDIVTLVLPAICHLRSHY